MARILVTGGAGFIGSHICEALLRRGDEVRVLDDLSTGFARNIEYLRGLGIGDIDFREGSVTDLAFTRDAVDGCDVVYHEAALASVPRSVEDPLASNDANVTGTLNVLVAARDAGVAKFIYAASSSAYGDSETLPKVETMPVNPLSPYAIAKLTGEQYVRVFAKLYDIDTLAIRYFNVFGPRQDPNSPYAAVIPIFVDCILEGRPPTIHGDGRQSRDFTYIDNVVHANLLALDCPRLGGEVVNVALGGRIDLLELYAAISEILGTDIPPEHGPPRAGDVKHSQADIRRAQELLGYEGIVDWRSGLEQTIAWYKDFREEQAQASR
jgi:nucleoside-diphosphate-sugar epimerase